MLRLLIRRIRILIRLMYCRKRWLMLVLHFKFLNMINQLQLNTPSPQVFFFRICIICGLYFRLDAEKQSLFRKEHYGDKSAGQEYWFHLRSFAEFIGFQSCKGDPDVWMQEATKFDGTEYWEYVLFYVENCLTISQNPNKVLWNEIGIYFQIEKKSISPPALIRVELDC